MDIESSPFSWMPTGGDCKYATEQEDIEGYKIWIDNLFEKKKGEYLANFSVTWDVFLEGIKGVRVYPVIAVAKMWMIPWQILAGAVDSGSIKIDFMSRGLKLNKKDYSSRIENMILGITIEEIERIEDKYPKLKENSKWSESHRRHLENREMRKRIKEQDEQISCLTNRIEEIESRRFHDNKPIEQKTTSATIAKLKKKNLALEDGYEGVAKLACELSKRGPRSGGPWSEDELLGLANELGVTLKGRCLKAFKKGMPSNLIKKEPGARPTHIGENTSKT